MELDVKLRELAIAGAKAEIERLNALLVKLDGSPKVTRGRRPIPELRVVGKRTMTPAQKAEVSVRMKRYWAARRKSAKART